MVVKFAPNVRCTYLQTSFYLTCNYKALLSWIWRDICTKPFIVGNTLNKCCAYIFNRESLAENANAMPTFNTLGLI